MRTYLCKNCGAEKAHPAIPNCLNCGSREFVTLQAVVREMVRRLMRLEQVIRDLNPGVSL